MDNNNGQGMEFRLVGGALQPVAEKFSTLEKVRDLDAALFAITSIDTASLRTNPLFLSFLDSDKNAKIKIRHHRFCPLEINLLNLWHCCSPR